ncbi:hypothetical protein [Nocardia pseudovaccinii]|uniref:hypothetical protein n=1 Tax=Nocardia pseudovaccinii TaxID=189540 RepID=UPI000A48C847|nr:hypothetical protein [Nocardia pseudovaccinii]
MPTLREIAEQAQNDGRETLSLGGPLVRYRSINTSEFDACMDWCAQLWMHVDEYDDTAVCVGCIDFLTIRLGREHVGADILDSYCQGAVEFSPLFDREWLDEQVQQQFEATPINDVLVVLTAQLAPPVRGHQLGAWMISQISDRMLSSHDGLIVLSPISDQTDGTSTVGRRARQRLDRYWRTSGLVPIDAHPEFLGQATAYNALDKARTALAPVAAQDITVAVQAIRRYHAPLAIHDDWD